MALHHQTEYPSAVTSADCGGIDEGVEWCVSHLEPGERLSVWTHLRKNLQNDRTLTRLATRGIAIDHVTARGGAYLAQAGPVLMAWADPTDIADIVGRNGNNITALCVVAWDEVKLLPWITAARPVALGTFRELQLPASMLDPVVEEGLKSLTRTINHSNTIAAGFEKDRVVATLLALHDAGYALDGAALAGWAVANGWTYDNPTNLEDFVNKINRGIRPQTRDGVRAGYIDILRDRAGQART